MQRNFMQRTKLQDNFHESRPHTTSVSPTNHKPSQNLEQPSASNPLTASNAAAGPGLF